MKLLIATLFLMFLSVVCAAQAPSDGSGLTVIKQKWHADLHDPSLDRSQDARDSDLPGAEQTPKRLEDESKRAAGLPVRSQPAPELTSEMRGTERSSDYIYEVTLRNNGTKDVSAVTWEYVFLSPDSEK